MVLKSDSLRRMAPEGKPDGESRCDHEGKGFFHTFTQEELIERYGKEELLVSEKPEVVHLEDKVEKTVVRRGRPAKVDVDNGD